MLMSAMDVACNLIEDVFYTRKSEIEHLEADRDELSVSKINRSFVFSPTYISRIP